MFWVSITQSPDVLGFIHPITVTVSPDYHLEVSRRIREEFENGREYYALHGNQIRLPHQPDRRLAGDYLRWHNENVFRG